MKTVYLLGILGDKLDIMGIFDNLEKALDNLKNGYFVVELPFNELFIEDKMMVVSYQMFDDKICVVSEDGTIIKEL